MRMSIDTVSKWLKIQRNQRCNKLKHLAPHLIGDTRIESLDTAISYLKDYQELLRKYEKIKEILDDDTYYENYGNNAEGFIVSAISEVIKDGNVN